MSETETPDDSDDDGRWWNPLARGADDLDDESNAEHDDQEEPPDEPDAETDADDGGLLARIRAWFDDDGLPDATLVDGAEAMFIDPAAAERSLGEYRLVVLTADAYPEPALLRARSHVSIAEGSCLCRAGESRLVKFGTRRVIVRDYALVPPDRVEELDPEKRVALPESLDGTEIRHHPPQHREFYTRLVSGAQAAEGRR